MFNFAKLITTQMTFEDIKQIPDLQIEVTPAVEDAFHFLYGVEKNGENITDAQVHCGQRLEKDYTKEESKQAMKIAYKMLDNTDKYGIPCAAWT